MTGSLVLLEVFKTGGMLSLLVYTGLLDLKTREIPPALWLYASIPLASLTLIELFLLRTFELVLVTIIGALIVSGSIGALYYFGLMGGGDLFAFIVLSLANPWNPLLILSSTPSTPAIPFPVSVLLYSSLAAALLALSYFVLNLTRNREHARRIPGRYRLLYMFTGLPKSVDELVKSRFWYPLERPWSDIRYRAYFDVGEEEAELKNKLAEMVGRGIISPEDKVWSTYGLPFIIFIFIGYLASLLGGDKLLLVVLSRIFMR